MLNMSPQQQGNISLKSPSSMMPNTFPRKFIGKTESILFETKPVLTGYFLSKKGLGYVIILAIIALFGMIFIIYTYNYYPFLTASAVLLIIAFLTLFFILPIFLILLSFSKTYYALTDSRILVASGILNKKLTSATYDMITSIDVIQPWLMNKTFNIGLIKFNIPQMRVGDVTWWFIKDPSETYRFIMDVKNLYDTYGAISSTYFQANIIGNVLAANVGSQKRCIKCGKYINFTAKFCPYCGAKQP